MLQTQDTTPHPVKVYRHMADLMWNVTLKCTSQLPILMSWVRPNLEILYWPSTYAANSQLNDAIVVAFSQNFSRGVWNLYTIRLPTAGSANSVSYPGQTLVSSVLRFGFSTVDTDVVLWVGVRRSGLETVRCSLLYDQIKTRPLVSKHFIYNSISILLFNFKDINYIDNSQR